MPIEQIGMARLASVGGKAAHLAELARIEGVHVPAGFCVTTGTFWTMLSASPRLRDRIDELSRSDPDDRDAVRTLSAAIREEIEAAPLPTGLAESVTPLIAAHGDGAGWAVRSSATAEDLPAASFAGQHDTYLNVSGAPEILRHISCCWASLFSERAVAYRARNGVDHRSAGMAVIVQRLLTPQSAGVLFTADPVTGNRTVACVEAVFGLGEALVSGRVEADAYGIRDGSVVSTSIGTKPFAVQAIPGGGTAEVPIPPGRRRERVLTDAQVVRLVELGRRIEAHLGRPQDIEWCLVGDEFHIVQSRPITTLFPVPAATDAQYRVYVSVGHAQMMTDPMRPLGISVWQHTALIPMHEAGGRLFVDVTSRLASPATRALSLDVFGRGDPLMRDALETVLSREDVLPAPAGDALPAPPAGSMPAGIETDPAIVARLVERSRASIAALRRDIRGRSGTALLDFVIADFAELKRILSDPRSHQAVMAGMGALQWLNDNMEMWLAEKGTADALMQSVPGNVTSEMGRALLDVADTVRRHPGVVALLQHAGHDGFLDELSGIPGGAESRDAIRAFLDIYGMRCVGEIDITRPRWSEHPVALVPLILGNIRNFEAGAARHLFEQGLREAENKERDLLERLRAQPGGAERTAETKQMIDRLRTFIGYREYPKYAIVSRHAVYKQALLEEADRLARARVLRDREDIFYLSLEEFRDVVRTGRIDEELVTRRREAFASHHALTPPRVLTSEGEALDGAYRRDGIPAGALPGLAVSAGVVEGRARVVLDIADADVAPGDILVTVATDPSWSPAFVAISGVVTEVGGLMTHGAVIAREYGLPAVVGVTQATRLIHDGQRIRVHGSEGYVELLPSAEDAGD
ncbi:MAG TPA: rifamycin-inactivating phosphotransferase [Streptosporangiaceae bacterium]